MIVVMNGCIVQINETTIPVVVVGSVLSWPITAAEEAQILDIIWFGLSF